MGTFGKSFTRELGKNTGKWVSNKVFGDGHATPHKLIHAREREKARKERDDARAYKEHQKQIERDRKERERQLREREKQIAEQEKQALIESNNQEVNEHNNYIEVIQSVHKDYSKPIDWNKIEELPDPEYIQKPEELKEYYVNYVNQQVAEKAKEAKKTYKMSPAKFILKKYYIEKNRWLFKLTGKKEFMAITGLLTMMGVYYALLSLEGFLQILLLSFCGLAIAFFYILHLGGKDFFIGIELQNTLDELKANREVWFKEYMLEQKQAHEQYLEDKKEAASMRKVAVGVKKQDPQSFIYAINLFKPFEDLQEYGSDISYELENDILVVNFYVHSEEVIPNTIKKILRKGLEIKEDQMPASRFNEIYQDYVCSCVLRIAKEIFQLVPLNEVIVNAKGSVLNSATGNPEDQTILSVKIERKTLDSLNFDLLDPSDSMRNFDHNMSFKKNEGFKATTELA